MPHLRDRRRAVTVINFASRNQALMPVFVACFGLEIAMDMPWRARRRVRSRSDRI
jgi:hypothetical protein